MIGIDYNLNTHEMYLSINIIKQKIIKTIKSTIELKKKMTPISEAPLT